MTLRNALRAATNTLENAGVDSPSLTAELLLAHVLSELPLRLRLDLNRELSAPLAHDFTDFVRRRATRIPLQHLIGTAPFLDLTLWVTRDVLIPRPETEGLGLLASAVLTEMVQSGAPMQAPPRVLDFATGSGCLALFLASQNPTAQVHALDVSPAAIAVARQNAQQLGLDGRVRFYLGDGFAALENLVSRMPAPFNLVVSNPPYIPSGEIAQLEPEIRNHEPHLALDGGSDGLDFYRRLAQETPAWLRPGGSLLAEFGDGQAEGLEKIFASRHWREMTITKDLSGRDRLFIARRPA